MSTNLNHEEKGTKWFKLSKENLKVQRFAKGTQKSNAFKRYLKVQDILKVPEGLRYLKGT